MKIRLKRKLKNYSMKYLFVFLLVGLSSICIGQSRYAVDETNYYDKDMVVLLKSTNEPVTGVVYKNYSDGQLSWEINYKYGKQDGLKRAWFLNGPMRLEENWIAGELEGISRIWYWNGQLEVECNYKEGERDGLYRYWYENGQPMLEYNVRKGRKHGLFRKWYENGQLRTEQYFKKGKNKSQKCWNHQGIARRCTIHD